MKVVFILGMHRSGTSCLAGCLEACGLQLGPVHREPGVGGNPKGTLEAGAVAAINDAFITSWLEPQNIASAAELEGRVERGTKFDDKILGALHAYLSQITNSASAAGLKQFGMKDPRFVLTLEHWLEAVQDFQLVATFRNPAAVCASLVARKTGGVTPASALNAWKIYNRKLLYWAKRFGFDLISYDFDQAAYFDRLKVLCRTLELEFHEQKVQAFYDQGFKRQTEYSHLQDEEAQRLHQALLDMS